MSVVVKIPTIESWSCCQAYLSCHPSEKGTPLPHHTVPVSTDLSVATVVVLLTTGFEMVTLLETRRTSLVCLDRASISFWVQDLLIMIKLRS